MTTNFRQGLYTVQYPAKYMGDPTKVRYMSSWELRTHTFFDTNPNVVRWGSETVVVPYIKPTDGKLHKYYVDYFVEYITKSGERKIELIEVKPLKQTTMSKARTPKTKLYENITFAVNTAKWMAAKTYAESKGWQFRIVTEQSIFK